MIRILLIIAAIKRRLTDLPAYLFAKNEICTESEREREESLAYLALIAACLLVAGMSFVYFAGGAK